MIYKLYSWSLCNGHMWTRTCTVAESKAQSLLGPVEHHEEAFHNSGADHKAVSGRWHSETEAVQCAVQVGDGLDVKLKNDQGGMTTGECF